MKFMGHLISEVVDLSPEEKHCSQEFFPPPEKSRNVCLQVMLFSGMFLEQCYVPPIGKPGKKRHNQSLIQLKYRALWFWNTNPSFASVVMVMQHVQTQNSYQWHASSCFWVTVHALGRAMKRRAKYPLCSRTVTAVSCCNMLVQKRQVYVSASVAFDCIQFQISALFRHLLHLPHWDRHHRKQNDRGNQMTPGQRTACIFIPQPQTTESLRSSSQAGKTRKQNPQLNKKLSSKSAIFFCIFFNSLSVFPGIV